jgi:transcriptional regulator with GAF, ATPase, and Fis domain
VSDGAASDASALPGGYLSSVEALLGLLLEETPFAEILEQVLELTARAVPSVDAAAVTVRRADGATDTAAASSDAARRLDEVQRELGYGPCVEAMDVGEERRTSDLRADERWDGPLGEAAAETGLVAVLAVPLSASGGAIGALNVFSSRADGIDEDAVASVRSIAGPVSATLANALAYHQVTELGDQLREALASRAVIEQAKGILMVRAGVDDDQAFALLRRTSQHQNRKLREVAASVVAMRDRLPPERSSGR